MSKMNLDKTSLWNNNELKTIFKIASMFYSNKKHYALKMFFIVYYLSNEMKPSTRDLAWLINMIWI